MRTKAITTADGSDAGVSFEIFRKGRRDPRTLIAAAPWGKDSVPTRSMADALGDTSLRSKPLTILGKTSFAVVASRYSPNTATVMKVSSLVAKLRARVAAIKYR